MEVTINSIYKEQYKKVLHYCKYKVNNVETAEDIASEVFVKVHNKLSEYNPEKSSIGTWVMNIAKNTIIDFWRSNKNQGIFNSINDFEDEDGHNFLVHTDDNTPQKELETMELREKIDKAINTLPVAYQTVAIKFLVQQCSYEEISKDLNIPLGTVKGNIHRMREMLQNRLLSLKQR